MVLKGKIVLVTGSEGFIGSHLIERLLKEQCNIRAFVLYNSFNSCGWLDTFPKELLKDVEIFTGDIRDPNSVRNAIKGVEIVFHLAALIGIPYSYHSPDSYIDTNIKGTLNILQACRDFDVERVFITSTSEVYGTAQYVPIDEKHPLQPQSPYSATKIGADNLAESFYRSFNLPVTIVRPFNTYGPRQSARAVIPTIITQLLSGCKEIQLGSLHPTRDLNYVTDICNGFIAVAKHKESVGKTINIGSGQEISIRDLAAFLIKLIKPGTKISSEDIRKRPDKSEVKRLVCDNSLIRRLTRWKPETSLEEGLFKTVDWFRNKEYLHMYKWHTYNV